MSPYIGERYTCVLTGLGLRASVASNELLAHADTLAFPKSALPRVRDPYVRNLDHLAAGPDHLVHNRHKPAVDQPTTKLAPKPWRSTTIAWRR
jgi:hypothetical protein